MAREGAMTGNMREALFAKHRTTLDQAMQAARSRGYFSAYPEAPSGRIYGETAKADAEAAYAALLGRPFAPGARQVGAEVSPWGPTLGITYPAEDVATLVARAEGAAPAWADAAAAHRAGVCLEILHRLNRDSFLMAQAVMHTTGQSWVMAFQAGGPHAQDRGLEAVAYAMEELVRVPGAVRWSKPAGKETLHLEKTFRIIPRGIGLVIGCATFPTWNGYPGLFASLATGNAVIVKPHPAAILPLALTVRTARAVLAEAGFSEDVVQLAPDTQEAPIAAQLAQHPAIGVVDFTGGPAFGRWLRTNVAGEKPLHTEEAGINPAVLHSTADFAGLCRNLAFSLSLYSGQMCTAPQNLFVPADGIATDQGRKTFDEIAQALAAAVDALLADPARASGVLGAIQNPATLDRIGVARGLGRVVRDSGSVDMPGFAEARSATPLILAVDAADRAAWGEERFGPIAFLIRCKDAEDALALAAASVREKGAITALVHSTDDAFLARAESAFAKAGVALSENLCGGLFVNQSAAFSDYHVSGVNPAGTSCLTDAPSSPTASTSRWRGARPQPNLHRKHTGRKTRWVSVRCSAAGCSRSARPRSSRCQRWRSAQIRSRSARCCPSPALPASSATPRTRRSSSTSTGSTRRAESMGGRSSSSSMTTAATRTAPAPSPRGLSRMTASSRWSAAPPPARPWRCDPSSRKRAFPSSAWPAASRS
jgi:phenylacetic acid degradation protein paaN